MITKISLKGTLISLIESIDMFNYLLKNHHRRVSVIAYNLGKHLGLDNKHLTRLVFAASLHDIGALTIEERDRLIEADVENPRNHEVIGCAMLKSFEPFTEIANIIFHHHIHWSDVGSLYKKSDIPIECYILHIADRIDILIDPSIDTLAQVETILNKIETTYEHVFAPWCVSALREISVQENFWLDIDYISLDFILSELTPKDLDIFIDEFDLEELALTFSRIVDYRSHFTAAHSLSVGTVAYKLAKLANLSQDKCQKIKIAGYLHDIGKIAIPTELIEKEGKLTPEEFDQVKLHSYYTYVILSRIKGLEDICSLASKHHEKYDGSGYPYHIFEDSFSIELDILAYADIFTSICEDRPYRLGSYKNDAIKILNKSFKGKLSTDIYNLIIHHFDELNAVRLSVTSDHNNFYSENITHELNL